MSANSSIMLLLPVKQCSINNGNSNYLLYTPLGLQHIEVFRLLCEHPDILKHVCYVKMKSSVLPQAVAYCLGIDNIP